MVGNKQRISVGSSVGLRIVAALSLVGLSACGFIGRSDQPLTGESTATSTTSEPEIAAPTVASTTMPPTTAATTTTTTTTTVAPTTTTLPPVPTANAASMVVPADAPNLVIESISDVVIKDDGSASYLAGTYQAAPGQPRQATVWVTDGRTRAASIPLAPGGADESWASGIATRGDQIFVAGTIRTGDRTAGVLWQSDDSGISFTDPQVIDDEVTEMVDVAFAEKNMVAVGLIRPAKQRPAPVALIGSGTTWTSIGLDGPDERSVESVTVNGPAIIVTGAGYLRGDESALLWLSGDDGKKFTAIESISEYRRIGPVTIHDGTYVTSADGKGEDPMAILTSPDGLAWTPTSVSFTRDGGSPYPSQYTGGGRVVVTDDGSYITDATSAFGYIGRIASSGDGVAIEMYYGRRQAVLNLIPFEIGGQVSVIANTERSFSIFAQSNAVWEYTGPVAAEGPTIDYTEMDQVGGDIAVRAASYPKVAEEGTRKGPSNFWSRYDGSTFTPVTGSYLPGDVTSWTANDTVEIALDSGAADPNDDVYAGPLGATMAWTRALPDGEWSDQEMILTGPGADSLLDIDRLGPGFVAVGYHSESGADQIFTAAPAILEYLDGVWATATLPALTGTEIELYEVAAAPSGLAIATGYSNDTAVTGPLTLSRGTDGVWTRIDLPVRDIGTTILNQAFSDDRFELLVDDGGTYALLSSTDGVTFDRLDLQFADPFLATPAATARIEGVTYVVGTAGYPDAEQVAVWEIHDDGSLTALDVTGDAPIGEVGVDTVITNGTDIWVGGQQARLGVVWKLNIDQVPAENPATTAPAESTPEAATTAAPSTSASPGSNPTTTAAG